MNKTVVGVFAVAVMLSAATIAGLISQLGRPIVIEHVHKAAAVKLRDGREVHLGMIRPNVRRYALNFGKVVNVPKLIKEAPPKIDYSAKAIDAIHGTYGNTQQGDCVIAGKLHQIGIWTGNESGKPAVSSDQEALNEYHQTCGRGDNGCVITDVLDVFRTRGLMCGGSRHRIDGYVSVDWTNRDMVRAAIYLFGTVTYGINLPSSWTCTNCTWDANARGSVGGHDVCAVGYDDKGVQICTWGGLVTITWDAAVSKRWIEECYAELSPDWYSKNNIAPCGYDITKLKEYLQQLGGGNLPPLPPPTPPNPPSPVPPTPGPPMPPLPNWLMIVLWIIQTILNGFAGYHIYQARKNHQR